MTDAADVLQQALTILGEDGEGWVQGTNYYEDGFGNRTMHCLFGAIAEVEGVVQDWHPENTPISDMLPSFGAYGQEACEALVHTIEAEDVDKVQELQDDIETEWYWVKDLIQDTITRLKRNREGGE